MNSGSFTFRLEHVHFVLVIRKHVESPKLPSFDIIAGILTNIFNLISQYSIKFGLLNNVSTYHRWVSLFTTTIMLWNVMGWLGTGLILNHTHHHDSKSLCEISFCYCEIDEGEKICTCHHQDHHPTNGHGDHVADGHHTSSTCYFTDTEKPNTTAFQLVESTKVMAFYPACNSQAPPPYTDTDRFISNEPLLEGISADLLRPPQV
jgi:hypothetical protein